jgi:hypothetical protein
MIKAALFGVPTPSTKVPVSGTIKIDNSHTNSTALNFLVRHAMSGATLASGQVGANGTTELPIRLALPYPTVYDKFFTYLSSLWTFISSVYDPTSPQAVQLTWHCELLWSDAPIDPLKAPLVGMPPLTGAADNTRTFVALYDDGSVENRATVADGWSIIGVSTDIKGGGGDPWATPPT